LSTGGKEQATCAMVREELADVCDGRGAPALRAHLETCVACATLVREGRALETALAALPAVALPVDFEEMLLPRLAAVGARHARRLPVPSWTSAPWLRASAVAAAAAVALVVVAVGLRGRPTAEVDATVAELVEVDVDVAVAAAMSGVDVRLALPDGLEVASDDPRLNGLHALAWRVDLAPGVNTTTVVLRAVSMGEHRLHVVLEAGPHRAEMDLGVLVHAGSAHAALRAWSRALFAATPRLRLELGGAT